MKHFFLNLFLCAFCCNAWAQDTIPRLMSVEQIFDLTLKNNQSLKVSESGISIARQRVEVVKTQMLPTLSVVGTAGYLGNAAILDKDFSRIATVELPHFSNSFALQASELIYKGGALKNNIAAASLQEQIAALSRDESALNIKLLVAGYYFDLYKFYNQRKVVTKNKELAELRLKQINSLYHEGMITRNDVIRSELQISNLKQTIVVINNNIAILNKQLVTAAGIDETTYIIPDTTRVADKFPRAALRWYQEEALLNYPSIKSAQIGVDYNKKGVEIAKADRLPTLSAFAGSSLQRPITTSLPALDAYNNGWQMGLNLSFNISSIYNAGRNIRLSELQVNQAKEAEVLIRQNREVVVNYAYVKYNEAITLSETLKKNVLLANENYRIIEKRYLNQLALLIDMLDASNAKLDAELQEANAEINVLYTYYQLQKETGNL